MARKKRGWRAGRKVMTHKNSTCSCQVHYSAPAGSVFTLGEFTGTNMDPFWNIVGNYHGYVNVCPRCARLIPVKKKKPAIKQATAADALKRYNAAIERRQDAYMAYANAKSVEDSAATHYINMLRKE